MAESKRETPNSKTGDERREPTLFEIAEEADPSHAWHIPTPNGRCIYCGYDATDPEAREQCSTAPRPEGVEREDYAGPWPRLHAMFEDMWQSVEEYTDGEISDEQFAARMERIVLTHQTQEQKRGYLRPSVLYFAVAMEDQLRKHDGERGPRGWVGDDPKALFRRLMQEAQELREVLGGPLTRPTSPTAEEKEEPAGDANG